MKKFLLAVFLSGLSLQAFASCYEGSLAEFRSLMLDRHNSLRAKHQVTPLVLTSELNRVAQKFAEKLARSDGFYHSGGRYGENLYKAWGMQPDGMLPTQSWYDEIKLYDFNNPGFSPQVGHFTQLVWAATTKLGVGVACGADGSVTVVANYDPPGNVRGQFVDNVPRP